MNRKEHFVNPYLPPWEYVPDGEPHVFAGRVYVYGSHDRFGGWVYCQNDYVCYSAPVDDLRDWRYEGVIYQKTQDPYNGDGHMCLYAPDVTRGPDGRYYLYYVLDKVSVVSVAVCDTPAGQYTFLGYVRHGDGTLYGQGGGDEPQYDPAVLTEGERTYLYTGFCFPHDRSRHGAMATVLGSDMLTIVEEPVFVMPSAPYSAGSGSEGHEFFEGPSIRKLGDTYYFVYCSVNMHELCYAVSNRPTAGFNYQGVLISGCDLGISDGKPSDKPMSYAGNIHGGLLSLGDRHYIFYHRHTNATSFSRQACFEQLTRLPGGGFRQAELSSCCGCGPLPGRGEYPAWLACHLIPGETPQALRGLSAAWEEGHTPKLTQDGRDGDEEPVFLANLNDGAIAGFKYFDFQGVKTVSVYTRGYGKGAYHVSTAWDGPSLGAISVDYTNVWTRFSASVAIPDGVHALYFTYRGMGNSSLQRFILE